MIDVGNIFYIYTYVLNTFATNTIKGRHISDFDDEGLEYKKTIRYMENKVLTDISFYTLINKEKIYVRRVVDYILYKLKYGENTITLVGKDIAAYEEMSIADVSRGISRLEELELIKPCHELPIFNGVKIKKNIYVVNHNYLFRGNIKQLLAEFNEQQLLLNKKQNESKI